jgi:hypothetical protein
MCTKLLQLLPIGNAVVITHCARCQYWCDSAGTCARSSSCADKHFSVGISNTAAGDRRRRHQLARISAAADSSATQPCARAGWPVYG